MLTILPESNARRRRSPGGMAWSFLLHVAVASLVTAATGMARDIEPAPTSATLDTLIWVMPSTVVPSGGGEGRGNVAETAQPTVPTIPAPVAVPTGITPPDGSTPAFEIGSPTGDIEVQSLGTRRGAGGDRPSSVHGNSHLAVPERLAAPLPGNPRPRYPDVLRSASIEGRVLVDCVVDTTGRIDPASVRIIDSDHERFTAAVRDVLSDLRFAPAEAGGRRVPQWVRIPFEFRLEPGSP